MPTDRENLKVVRLRVPEDTQALADKAASIQECPRVDFIIEAAGRAGEEAISDQPVIMVSRESYDHFRASLRRPRVAEEKLVGLLRSKAPWDQ